MKSLFFEQMNCFKRDNHIVGKLSIWLAGELKALIIAWVTLGFFSILAVSLLPCCIINFRGIWESETLDHRLLKVHKLKL